MRLVAGVVSAMVLSAPVSQARGPNLIINNLRGSLHVSQRVPCGGVVEATTSIADGIMHNSPSLVRADVIGPNTVFDLTRLDMFFTPFSIQRECLGLNVNLVFTEIGVRLASVIRFTGQSIGDGRYRFMIPKRQFLVYESVATNLPVPQPMTDYKRPSEDVTGEIDLRRGTAQLHVVLSSRLRFRLGCVHKRCVIDEIHDGTQTTDVTGVLHPPDADTDADGSADLVDNCPLVPNATQSPIATPRLTAPNDVTVSSCQASDLGTPDASEVCRNRPLAISNNSSPKFVIGPNIVTWRATDGIAPPVFDQQVVTVAGADTRPPTLACTPVGHPRRYRPTAEDDCGGRLTLKLGTFVLENGEQIQIEETGKPGVRLVGKVGNDGVRHFLVGKGEALVLATDDSGNVARAACGVPVDILPRK
jgi:hypothetical protein